MTFIITVVKFILNVVYFFFKFFKRRKQITLISRLSNTITTDFDLLSNGLKKSLPDYKVVVLCKKLDNKISYMFHMLKQMYHISRSEIVVIDSYCILISMLKHKKNLKVIQIWHAIGLVKKAGYAILGKGEGRNKKVSLASNMHKNYDYVFYSSKECIPSMAKVFNCDESIVHSVPLPRIDLLKNKDYINNKKKDIFREYPKLKKKINILYAPTFRKNEKLMQSKLEELCESIDYSKYNLIVKLHPLSKIKCINDNVITAEKISTTEMIYVSDFVISDYSSIIYEAGIMNKKLIFYAFDLKSYSVKRSFFIDYENDLPGPIFSDAKSIVDFIKKGSYNKYKTDLISKYVDLSIDNYTENMVNAIKRILEKKGL